MSIQDLVKEIVRESCLSFTTTNNGEGFCGIESNPVQPPDSKLREFRSAYLSAYGLEEKDIKGYQPFCLMFHVLGITDTLRTYNSLVSEEFLDCLVKLYRLSGVTEIKKDV